MAESFSAPRLVSATARRHGLSASQLFAWRRLARDGRLVEVDSTPTFAQAVISCDPSTNGSPSLPERLAAAENAASPVGVGAPGRMEIVLMRRHRVIVDASVDAAALERIIAVLERRR